MPGPVDLDLSLIGAVWLAHGWKPDKVPIEDIPEPCPICGAPMMACTGRMFAHATETTDHPGG